MMLLFGMLSGKQHMQFMPDDLLCTFVSHTLLHLIPAAALC